MATIPYQKISGAGNTFIVIDGKSLPTEIDLSRLAQAACRDELEHGGADGLIVIAEADGYNFEMKYYNRDGSTGMMCGNGGRCAVLFAAQHGYVGNRDDLSFTNAGVPYRAALTEMGVRISFPDPNSFLLRQTLDVNGTAVPYHYGDVGTPHAVIVLHELADALGNPEMHSVDQLDLTLWGPAVRNHSDFAPQGANANFIEILPGETEVRLRTFERGVEAETGACGTGAVASAIIASMLYGLSSPIRIIPTSNSPLQVGFNILSPDHVTDLTLEGGAVVLLEGELEISEGRSVKLEA